MYCFMNAGQMKWDQAYHFQLFTLSVCCLADAVLVAGIAVLHMKQVVRAACRLPLCSSELVLIYITILICALDCLYA